MTPIFLFLFLLDRRRNPQGAPASKIGLEEVSPQDKKQRSKVLRDLSLEQRQAFMGQYAGTVQTVLAEQEKDGMWSGLTDNFIRVRFKAGRPLHNEMVEVELQTIDGEGMTGRLI